MLLAARSVGPLAGMNAASSSESLLEELYRVRDQLSEVVHVLQQSNPDEIVASLSSLRTVSLHLLRNYTEFVELLEVKTRASDSQDAHVQTAMTQIRQTSQQLEEVANSAAQAQGNIADLRNERLDPPRYT